MPIFSKSPEKILTDKLDTAKANVDRLAARLTDAEGVVISSKHASQQTALDGNDAALDAAEAAERAALHRLDSFRAAHAEAGKVLATIETQLAELTDKKTRAQTASVVEALADELVEAGAAYLASTALFNAVLARVLPLTYEANGLTVFTAASQVEVAAALPTLTEILRQHARAVLQGFGKAEMPAPEPTPVNAVPVAKETLTRVFSTRAIRWKDGDGVDRCSQRYVDCDLPPATAARALKIGAALPLDHLERKRNLGAWPGTVSLNSCFDLDNDQAGTAPPHDSTVHSAFTVVDRGKPFTLRVAGAAS